MRGSFCQAFLTQNSIFCPKALNSDNRNILLEFNVTVCFDLVMDVAGTPLQRVKNKIFYSGKKGSKQRIL